MLIDRTSAGEVDFGGIKVSVNK